MLEESQKGRLYSELYLARKEPASDSPTFRARVGYYIDSAIDSDLKYKIAQAFKFRKGVSIDFAGAYHGGYDFETFLRRSDLRDALDLITIVARSLNNSIGKKYFLDFVGKVFEQEHLQYKLDAKGGVHPLIDQEFQHNKDATLLALNGNPLRAARHEYLSCFDKLTAVDPDYKAAIRALFECAEIIVKDKLGTQNLGKYVLEKVLKPKLDLLYSGDDISAKVSTQQIAHAVGWTEACHYYRHGQPATAPIQPPAEIAINLISSGTSIIRWLIHVLQKMESDGIINTKE